MSKKTILISLSAVSLILSFFNVFKLPFDLSWIAILLCGIPIIMEAGEALIKEFDITADLLVAMAIIASVCIGEFFAAGEVALIMALGEELENYTVAKARMGIQRLVSLTPVKARVVHGDAEQIVTVDQVQVGDIIKVLPGEKIPVDGVILSGQTSIDQSAMTGESMPVDKKRGDEVSSGTVNQFGSFTMEALRRGEDSSIQRMIQLVESADAGKSKIVHLADRWAFWIVLMALSTAVITGIVTRDLIRSVTVLVVFCPCALVLATPVAIVAAIGNVSKHGFLVKEGDALERLSMVRKVALDKTGTLTYGVPSVVAVVSASPELTEPELFHIAASAEQFSEHPLGKAVVSSYRKTTKGISSETSDFVMLPGNGVKAVVAGSPVMAGNSTFLQNSGILLAKEFLAASEVYQKQGCTVIYIAKEGRIAGFIALADELRPESCPLMRRLKSLGIEPVLLTGDTHAAASSVVSRLEIEEFHAGCLPEDKMAHIAQYQKEHKPVCMIGDGINDAPALRLADVGIAMGRIGSDIASTAADIVLINDHIHTIDHIIALSRRMMTTIKCNIIFSLSLNFLAVVMAVTGYINPVAGALVHNGGSFLVIANSALLLYYKKRRGAAVAKSRKGKKNSKKNYTLIAAALILLAALLVLVTILHWQPSAKPETPAVPETPKPEPQVQPQPAPVPEPVPEPAPVPEKPKKRIYIILDDGGHNTRQLMPFLEFPGKLSIAVIPRLAYSKEVAELTHKSGKTVMLHQPMQPLGKADPGAGAIYVNMSDNDVRKTLNDNLDSIPHVVGFNNHMGSAATSDERIMDVVLKVAKQRNLFFVDSFTHSGSVCAKVAKKNGMRIARRDIFLDNDKSREKMIEAFNEGKAVADKKGYAVLIGHVWSDNLAQVMMDMYPEFIEEGYCFESVSDFFTLEKEE